MILVTSLTRRLAAASVLARSNFVAFERPDRLVRAVLASLPWGLGTAGAIAAACARYPEVAAVVDDEGAITYAELWHRSDGIAARLVELGARQGTAVGVLCRNHRGFVEAAVAVTKTEADLVLLNTGFAGPQLADVVASEGVSILLHDDEFADIVADAGATAVDETALTAAATSGRSPRPTRHQGRTVILTSGTTGRPKGAARRPAASAIEGVTAVLERVPLRVRDTVVVAAPLFHAWGLTHLLMGLGRDATVVVSRRFDPAATLAAVERNRARVSSSWCRSCCNACWPSAPTSSSASTPPRSR